MKPIKTPSTNTTLTLPGAKDAEASELPALRAMVRDFSTDDPTPQPAWFTTWMPDEQEAQRLEAGAAIELMIIGPAHPPVALVVTDAVIPERELIDRGHVDRALGALYGVLQERITDAVLQMQHDNVDADDLVTPGGDINPEAVGLPGPAAFADLWSTAVEDTKTDRTDPTEPPPADVTSIGGAA